MQNFDFYRLQGAFCCNGRSEGFPARDIWFLGVMVQGLYQMGRVLGKPPPPPSPSPPSLGKCPNIRKCALFQNGHVLKYQKSLFSRNKSPCGSFPHKVTFSEFTWRELIHFHRDLKNGGPPIFLMLVTFFQDFAKNGRKPKWSGWSIGTYPTARN